MKGKKLKCQRCQYEWTYTGKLVKATCPSCGTKVWVREIP